MSEHLISMQIAKYRKAAGLTQEELGEAVGISGQAVSRWECGGAPDITLLPAFAVYSGQPSNTCSATVLNCRRWVIRKPAILIRATGKTA